MKSSVKILSWSARPWVYWPFVGVLVVLLYVLIVGIEIRVDIDTLQLKRFKGHAIYMPVAQPLGGLYAPSDTREAQERSKLTLYENDRALGPAHSLHKGIRGHGAGAYLHWNGDLVFSTSDNSDVRTNGRRYWYRANFLPQQPVLYWLVVVAWAVGAVVLAGTAVRLHRHKMPFKRVGLVALLGLACALLLPETNGVPFVSLVAIVTIASVFVAASVVFAMLSARAYRRGSRILLNLVLTLGSVAFVAVVCEGALQFLARAHLQTKSVQPSEATPAVATPQASFRGDAWQRALERQRHITIPKEWEKRPADVKDTFKAYYWHDALHIHNKDGMRQIGDFPEKDPDRFRIMVVGDSLTYGVGIEQGWTYPTLLQRKLETQYTVEVLNLGVEGLQSEDIVEIVKRFYDELKPDLVVYGICLNDFLDSGERIYDKSLLKVPKFVKLRSKFPNFLADKVNGTARKLGISMDFYDDILKDESNYRKRFSEDLSELNAFVRGRRGPPVLAMVLNAYPAYGDRGYRLARIAERAAEEAGIDVVEVEQYHRQFNGQIFRVSAWEGHPNEIAHDIFSSMLAEAIPRHCSIDAYAREP